MFNRSGTGELPENPTEWEEELENEYYEGLAQDLDPADSEPVAARLEDGSLLIVGGPGTGTLTDSSTVRIQETALVSERDTALSGRRPLLLVHRPYQNAGPVPRLLAEIQRTYGGDLALGVSAPLPQLSQTAHGTWNSDCLGAAVKIADPRGYLLDGDLLRLGQSPISARGLKYAPYLGRPGCASWVADVLDAQRQAGANLLLTAGRALDVTAPQAGLDQLCREGDEALAALESGERLGLNITISAEWLTQPATRDVLLSQLLDQEQFDVWHFRVQWPAAIRSWAQPESEDLLGGYKRLAELAEDEERTLLLPQTGLTGWFLQAFGVAGFGIGLSGSDNGFREFSMGRGTRIERYFEKQLLHTVERTTHDQLRQAPDYAACGCRYCRALEGREVWSHAYAAHHYALAVAELTAETARAATGRGGKQGHVRRTVRAALAFARDKPLLDTNVPQHLPVWDRIL